MKLMTTTIWFRKNVFDFLRSACICCWFIVLKVSLPNKCNCLLGSSEMIHPYFGFWSKNFVCFELWKNLFSNWSSEFWGVPIFLKGHVLLVVNEKFHLHKGSVASFCYWINKFLIKILGFLIICPIVRSFNCFHFSLS